MGKTFKASALIKSVLKRVAHPGHLVHAYKLSRSSKKTRRVRDDAELALIGKLLPGGFLHYGYFDDVTRDPREISLGDIVRAQARYAELLIEQIKQSPILDVGCGMGGLIRVLGERGTGPVVALTPDRTQMQYVTQTYPDVPMIHAKFEELADPNHAEHKGRYGTIITSESLQYLKLDASLPLLASLLQPGGRWIDCDYFRHKPIEVTNGNIDKSGHVWDDFHKRLADGGWRIVHEQDITANILPTLRVLHMWGYEFGLPVLDFAYAKVRRRHPGMHHLFEEGMAKVREDLSKNLEVISPEAFVRDKRYALLVMERA